MKTLDEVIKAKELCNDHYFKCDECSYYDDDNEVGCRSDDLDADALHYLKEYRATQTAYIKAMADLEDNPPLTWDELLRMEEKPVWVENVFGLAEWELISRVKEGSIVTIAADESIADIQAEDYPHRWQAYRKERE